MKSHLCCLLCSALCRLQNDGESEVRGVQDEMSNLDAQAADLDLKMREKEDDIKGLQVRLWRLEGCRSHVLRAFEPATL